MGETLDRPGDRIRRARAQRQITREQLAEAAGLPSATIRRIERGALTRCDEALAIARAVDVAPDDLFPEAFRRLRAYSDDRALNDAAWNDRSFRRELGEHGIDIHPAAWFLKIRFRGGGESVFPIASPDLDRFWAAFEDDGEDSRPTFILWHCDDHSVAVNLAEVAHVHALFEGAHVPIGDDEEDDEQEAEAIEVLLAGDRESLTFGADGDEPEDPDDPATYQGQLHAALDDLEHAPLAGPVVSFDDEDGERVAFRADAVAYVSNPHGLLWGFDDDGLETPVVDAPPPARQAWLS
ncbi:MAG: helix-turn-helix transcriptional regulator [Deltaproteobacteria bacterium]|nr:helix-turn-helix transcriptional regulator [Deltaproteobacteria bacterium]